MIMPKFCTTRNKHSIKKAQERSRSNQCCILALAQTSLKSAKDAYDKNNASTIKEFNAIYNVLLAKLSYKSIEAYIDADYMPFIDNKEYKATN